MLGLVILITAVRTLHDRLVISAGAPTPGLTPCHVPGFCSAQCACMHVAMHMAIWPSTSSIVFEYLRVRTCSIRMSPRLAAPLCLPRACAGWLIGAWRFGLKPSLPALRPEQPAHIQILATTASTYSLSRHIISHPTMVQSQP